MFLTTISQKSTDVMGDFLFYGENYMAKQVPWNKILVERFIEQAMLTKDEEWVLRTRVAGWSITKQSLELGYSTSTVNRIVSELKRKYDNVAKYDPMLPPRKTSPQEKWMDEN